jgi:hypothetical protein
MKPENRFWSEAVSKPLVSAILAGTLLAGLATPAAGSTSEQQTKQSPETIVASAPEVERSTDPVTGYVVDPARGLPIHPATGYLVNPSIGLLYVPDSNYYMDPETKDYYDRDTLLPVIRAEAPEPETEPDYQSADSADGLGTPSQSPAPTEVPVAKLGEGERGSHQTQAAESRSAVGTSPLLRSGVAAGLIGIAGIYYLLMHRGRRPAASNLDSQTD